MNNRDLQNLVHISTDRDQYRLDPSSPEVRSFILSVYLLFFHNVYWPYEQISRYYDRTLNENKRDRKAWGAPVVSRNAKQRRDANPPSPKKRSTRGQIKKGSSLKSFDDFASSYTTTSSTDILPEEVFTVSPCLSVEDCFGTWNTKRKNCENVQQTFAPLVWCSSHIRHRNTKLKCRTCKRWNRESTGLWTTSVSYVVFSRISRRF